MAGQRAGTSAESYGRGVAGAGRCCHERASGTCRDEGDLTCQLRPAQRCGRQGACLTRVEAGERKPQSCRRTARNRTHDAVQQTGRIWIEVSISATIAGNSLKFAIFAEK